jgi:hypothetical protein
MAGNVNKEAKKLVGVKTGREEKHFLLQKAFNYEIFVSLFMSKMSERKKN